MMYDMAKTSEPTTEAQYYREWKDATVREALLRQRIAALATNVESIRAEHIDQIDALGYLAHDLATLLDES